MRSTTKDMRTTRLPDRYRKPSSTAAKPQREVSSSGECSGGIGVSRNVAQIGAIVVRASMKYSVDRSTHRSSTPASSGPMIAPAWNTVMLSELAAGSCSAGSIRGIAAERVGELIA